ncbi:uncharacterized protein LOC131957126 [Physella acuta]|uniref:uncharacterized protein LOC131957126 n=1 Tax=Physella acuta TaxID=109671 RepID=UPI0027DB79C7|nr:uncharacterized protein LOC131957126 [Physella acuta]
MSLIEMLDDVDVFSCFGLTKIRTLSTARNLVYLTRHIKYKSVQKVVKVYENDKVSTERFKSEVEILQKLHHPNIMAFDRAAMLASQNVILMPYCELGALYHHVGKISLFQLDDYLLQMCGGVKYLHSQNIVHRDIKLDNILLDAGQRLYITDFDLSCTVPPGNPVVHQLVGTDAYMAPEMLASPKGYYDGFKLDVYALGVVLWCLLFQADIHNPVDYLDVTHTHDWPFSMLFYKWVLLNVLQPDPALRWDIEKMVKSLGQADWLAERALLL